MTGPVRQAAQKALSFGRVAGDLLWRAYVNHLLVFAIGAILGAVTAFTVLTPYIVAAAR